MVKMPTGQMFWETLMYALFQKKEIKGSHKFTQIILEPGRDVKQNEILFKVVQTLQ